MHRSITMLLVLSTSTNCAGNRSLSAGPLVAAASTPQGDSIRYEVTGDGDMALVFVHCWMCDRTYWRYQRSHFANTYQVVTLDLGGHGESKAQREVWDPETYADDVVAVANALKLQQMVLVGHSMGGPVAVAAARKLGNRVRGLVAVDTLINVEDRASIEAIESYLAPFQQDFPAHARKFVSQQLFPPEANAELVKSIADDIAGAPAAIALDSLRGLFAYDLVHTLSETKIPIRSINSDLFPTQIDINRRHIADYDVHVLEGLGHFPHLEQPALFNQTLERVLTTLPGPNGL